MRTSLFHGTIADIQGAVRPVGRGKGSVWGSTGWRFGQRADEHAFATEREDQAWDFASAAHRGHRQPNEALGHQLVVIDAEMSCKKDRAVSLTAVELEFLEIDTVRNYGGR